MDIQPNHLTERQLIKIPIEEGIISLRGLSPKRLRFEIEYGLERGSTSNSFLLTHSNKYKTNNDQIILINPPGDTFSDLFLKAIQKEIPLGNAHLSILIGHVNPNRISLLKKLVNLYPNTKVICSSPGAKLISDIWRQKKPTDQKKEQHGASDTIQLPELQIIRSEHVLELSNEYRLRLIPAATARWPGGLWAFEETLGILMSDKFFGAHLCTESWAESNRSSTEEDRRYYFDCLMAPMVSQVNALIEKLEELEIRTIAPGHGPAIESSWRSLLNDYRCWGENQHKDAIKVALIFASAYGNTAAIADALATGINRTGVKVESLNCEFASTNELISTIKKADGYLIGSPTLGGHAPTPIVSALGSLLSEGDKEKPVGIFGSYGWSGEAIDLLESKLSNGGFDFAFKPIRIQFSPNTLIVKQLEETGTSFGRKLLKLKTLRQPKVSGSINASRNDPLIQALGRIVGSLCVLTAKKGEGKEQLTGAMIASWVSQASFAPPGLSIAVAKDRAVGALLHCGDHFTLNVLAAGRQSELMKQFLQPFPPGTNRFSGLTIDESPNGQPILPEGLAWLDGTVRQRMECGDHWLIYAEIEHGKVIDLEGTTAIHHRKIGSNY